MEELEFRSQGGSDLFFRSPRADNVIGNGARVWTSGINWYSNRWVKVQGNGIRESFSDAVRTPRPGTRQFWRVLRMQLVI